MITIDVGAIFHENNKYYPQVLLDECLHKIRNMKMESKGELKETGTKNCTCDYFGDIII